MNQDNDNLLRSAAEDLKQALVAADGRIVFAESCTCGRVAATLGEIPGISARLCGSFVVYRNASKSGWLGVDPAMLDDPEIGSVSHQASAALAKAALVKTPEADIAIAVTGDVGPGAPVETDGRIFLAAAWRARGNVTTSEARRSLRDCYTTESSAAAVRRQRLIDATIQTLRWSAEQVAGSLGE